MPTCPCQCGAKYRVAEAAVGKKAKCHKCGAVFVLQEEDDGSTIPLAGDAQWEDKPAAAAPVVQQSAAVRGSLGGEAPARPIISPPTPARGYANSLLWTLLFPASAPNLVTFIVIWAVLAVGGRLPFISIVLGLWYAGYRFAVVETAAAGESDLPDVNYSTAWGYEMLYPVFQWFGSWVVVMLPAVAYTAVAAYRGSADVFDVLLALTGGVAGLLQTAGADPIPVILVCLGIILWPMIILCVALGGLTTVYRIDLILVTVFRSLGPYMVTLIVVGAATVTEVLLSSLLAARMTGGTTPASAGRLAGSAIVVRAMSTGITLYCNIVMLRAIGLYYHHFKHRFAWNWG